MTGKSVTAFPEPIEEDIFFPFDEYLEDLSNEQISLSTRQLLESDLVYEQSFQLPANDPTQAWFTTAFDASFYQSYGMGEMPPPGWWENPIEGLQNADVYMENTLLSELWLPGSYSSIDTNDHEPVFWTGSNLIDLDPGMLAPNIMPQTNNNDHGPPGPAFLPSPPTPNPKELIFINWNDVLAKGQLDISDSLRDGPGRNSRDPENAGACWKCKILRKKCSPTTPCKCCLKSTDSSPWKSIGCKRGPVQLHVPYITLCPIREGPSQNILRPADPVKTSTKRSFSSRESKTTSRPPDFTLFVKEVFSLIRDFQRIYPTGYFHSVLKTTGLYDSDFSDLLVSAIEVYRNSISAGIMRKSVICLRDCLLTLKSSIVHSRCSHDKCSTSGCRNSWVTALESRLVECIESFSCEMFKKRKSRNDKSWWLAIFYSLCIQTYIGKALTVIRRVTSSSGESCLAPMSMYLALAIQFFAGVSADFDPIMDSNIGLPQIREGAFLVLKKKQVESSILYLRFLFEGANGCLELPRSWPLCENALRRLSLKRDLVDEIKHNKYWAREQHSEDNSSPISGRSLSRKSNLLPFSSASIIGRSSTTDEDSDMNDILGIANLNLLTDRDCPSTSIILQSATKINRKLSFGVQREPELIEILLLPGDYLFACGCETLF